MSVSSSADPSESSPLVANSSWRSLSNADSQGISPIIRESHDSVTIRRPLSYNSIHNAAIPGPTTSIQNDRTSATINRYKYYNKLTAQNTDNSRSLLMPNHVVPPEFFLVIPIEVEGGKQNSLITIFSIWNTMMGTSLLSMPWALSMAGFGFGISIMIIMAGLTLYTAYRVMKSINTPALALNEETPHFSDVCRYYLGRPGAYAGIIFSLIALLGAAIVYWVLMTNFLYNTVTFIYQEVYNEMNTTNAILIGNVTIKDAYCPNPKHSIIPPATVAPPVNYTGSAWFLSSNTTVAPPPNHDSTFKKVWHQTHTVPFFLIIAVLPLLNFKSPTFFTKFNALGTFSVVYILVFVITKASQWGINIELSDTQSIWYIPEFKWTFPALTGMLSLAFFIHNCVISIVQNQKHPENNGRDLSIAYICVALTYLIVGILFYISFPLAKSCIEDNLLNNFRNSDIMAFIARICLFIQMLTVFPLLMYIMRAQLMYAIYGNLYPSLKHVFALNCMIITICLMFAIFLPQIGTIIRFSGALCGLVYIFSLPCLIFMLSRREAGTLTKKIIVIHVGLIAVGVLNFIAQFLIIGT